MNNFTKNVTKCIKDQYGSVKMFIFSILIGFVLALTTIAFIQRDSLSNYIQNSYDNFINKTIETIKPDQTTPEESEQDEKFAEDKRIGEYVLFIMNFSQIKMTDFQKQLLAQTIVRVTGSIFSSETERQYFVALVNNESRFDRNAKSGAGAVGLTQVMPQYIKEFGGHCNIDVSSSEVMDTETNLLLGACRFKHLLSVYKGVYTTALAAYNAGKHAKSVKELQRLEKISNEETLQYIARFAHVTAVADANFKLIKTTNKLEK